MTKLIGILLIALAVWQLSVALRIGRIGRADIQEDEKQARVRSLNKTSKIVQVVALTVAAIIIFMEA